MRGPLPSPPAGSRVGCCCGGRRPPWRGPRRPPAPPRPPAALPNGARSRDGAGPAGLLAAHLLLLLRALRRAGGGLLAGGAGLGRVRAAGSQLPDATVSPEHGADGAVACLCLQ